MTTKKKPKRGEIWWVNLDPTIGSEIKKKRPAVVVSSDGVGHLPIRLIAPITQWHPAFNKNLWHIPVQPNGGNNLRKRSAVDALQLRAVDIRRFDDKLGRLSAVKMEEVATAIALVIEYSPN